MSEHLDSDYKKCGVPYPSITASSAAHDANLIDVVVTCEDCGHTLNAFIALSEMTVITVSEEEAKDD